MNLVNGAAISVPAGRGCEWRKGCEGGMEGGGRNNAKICAQWAAVERRHCSGMIGHASFPVPPPQSKAKQSKATARYNPAGGNFNPEMRLRISSKVHLFSSHSPPLLNVHTCARIPASTPQASSLLKSKSEGRRRRSGFKGTSGIHLRLRNPTIVVGSN